MTGLPPLFQAVLWFCGTMAGFAGMAIAARGLHTTMSTFEILFFRSLIGVLFVLPFLMHRRFVDLRTTKLPLHLGRAAVQFGAQICWIYGIVHLTLSDLVAIEFSIPLFTALLAVGFLGERMWRHKWVATIVGFGGVLLILRPEGSAFNVAGAVMIFGSVLYAASGVLVKYLTRTETPQGIIFWMNIAQLPFGLGLAVFWHEWVTPGLRDVPWILVWGLAGLWAHYSMARALKLADITVIFPLDFLRLPVMAVIGYLLFQEAMDPWTGVGALIIFAGNWYSVREETRRGGTPAAH